MKLLPGYWNRRGVLAELLSIRNFVFLLGMATTQVDKFIFNIFSGERLVLLIVIDLLTHATINRVVFSNIVEEINQC